MSLLTYNRTKIVCTIGPASESEEVLKDLIKEGMDVARLNFSHGTHDDHLKVLKRVRKINDDLGTHIAVLQDLQGPKIRIGKLEKPFTVKAGDQVILNNQLKSQDGNRLPIQYESFAQDVRKGDLVLIDDGKVELIVEHTNKKDEVILSVRHGSEIGSKKGVNFPYTNMTVPSITEKDLRDVEWGIENDVDWIALSFIRTPEEVRELKRIIQQKKGTARIIAKIEKPEALKNIDEIIDVVDAIMIARGDLGVEIPMEDVPLWQKTITRKCNMAGKPVIVATQMMESMITNRRPTRAETNDVANAVMDGADAIMLSGETSVGKFPIEVVRSMQKIVRSMEEQDEIYFKNLQAVEDSDTYLHDSLIVNACNLADQTDATAMVGMTVSGYTAYQLSRCRPKSHIFIFTENKKLLNIMNLVWGVRAFYYDKFVSTDETIQDVNNILREKGYVKKGDIIINLGSMPLQARQRTNMLKISVVE